MRSYFLVLPLPPAMLFAPKDKIYVYELMTLEDRTINYKVFNKEGNVIDHFTIIK